MPKTADTKKKDSSRPAMSAEAVENRLISKAYKAVEKRIEDGTATAAELTHFLRLGSAKEQLELEKLKKENALLTAKTESLRSQEEVKELYAKHLEKPNSHKAHELLHTTYVNKRNNCYISVGE